MSTSANIALHLFAILSLFPAALTPLRRPPQRDRIFWITLGLAILGPTLVTFVPATMDAGWNTSFSNAIWGSISIALLVFLYLCLRMPGAWKMLTILLPYLMGLGVIANVWSSMEDHTFQASDNGATWLTMFHVAIALLIYALLTNAAMASLSAYFQERALKRKRPTGLTRRLPAATEADRIAQKMLVSTEVVLFIGIITGFALTKIDYGVWIDFNHKTIFSLLAFVLIAILLFARAKFGVRGRTATRAIMWSYLFVTLAFPGIKLVTDFIL